MYMENMKKLPEKLAEGITEVKANQVEMKAGFSEQIKSVQDKLTIVIKEGQDKLTQNIKSVQAEMIELKGISAA